MTDRIHGIVVTLDKDIRIDDAQPTIDAIKQIKGVIDARPVATSAEDHLNRMRVRTELAARLWEVIHGE